MGIEIEYPSGYANSGDRLFRDTGTHLGTIARGLKTQQEGGKAHADRGAHSKMGTATPRA